MNDTYATGSTTPGSVNSMLDQLAVVLDGKVVSRPLINQGPITAGPGRDHAAPFTQEQATKLANVLKYGALPLTFEKQSSPVGLPAARLAPSCRPA